GIDISPGNTSGGNDGIGTDSGSRQQDGARCNPSSIADRDGAGDKLKSSAAVIVASRAEINLLRQTNVAANRHVGEVIDPYPLSNPHMITNGEPPRELNLDLRLYHDTCA